MCQIQVRMLFPIELAASCAKAAVKEDRGEGGLPCAPGSPLPSSITPKVEEGRVPPALTKYGQGGVCEFPESPEPVFTLREAAFVTFVARSLLRLNYGSWASTRGVPTWT